MIRKAIWWPINLVFGGLVAGIIAVFLVWSEIPYWYQKTGLAAWWRRTREELKQDIKNM